MHNPSLKPIRHLWNHFLGKYAYHHQKVKVENRPEVFAIEVTNHCNLNCIMCPRRKMTREIGMISFGLFKNIIDQIKDYDTHVLLHGFGEPLFHPQLDKMINYCAKNGLTTELSTNAAILNKENASKILNGELDKIIISSDGITKETYEKVRSGANFEQTKDNIVNFLKLKREMSFKKPYTVLQIIQMNETEKEIADFKKQWEPYADEILIKRFTTWGEQVEGIKELSKIEHRFRSVSEPRYPCLWLWTNVVVQWNGDVVPCCFDYDSKCILGNLKEKTLVEVWNSDKMLNLRKQQLQSNYENPLCKQCIDWQGEPAERLYPVSPSILKRMINFVRES